MAAATWRSEGNRFYKSASKNVHTLIKSHRLRRALVAYSNSLKFSESDEDKASAHKNLAMTCVRLASYEEMTEHKLFHYNDAAKHFRKARASGAEVKSKHWLKQLQDANKESVDAMVSFCKELTPQECVKQLSKYTKLLEQDAAYAECCFYVLELHYSATSATIIENAEALRDFESCLFYLDEIARFGQPELLEKAQVYRPGIMLQIKGLKAKAALARGDGILKKLTENPSLCEETEDDMFLCIDSYKEAEVLTRGVHSELEAECLSKLGVVFAKLLKNSDKASEYFNRTLELARSIKTSDVTSTQWYKDAWNGLEFILKTEKVSESEIFTSKSAFNQANADVIEELRRKHEAGTHAFLTHIYTRHPPKNVVYQLPEVTPSNIDRLLKRALLHYHSDKQTRFPQDWQFLCEHISMGLATKYELLKPRSNSL
mmetsp:Transcript_5483/g.10049  ORF Transcript_5483/g.10049 Transcript_5483/m.10049 type:complete len:431 (+) Transcript_5483:26-1318(+)